MTNSVEDILTLPFSERSFEGQLKIINDGKPRPSLPNLTSVCKDKNRTITRYFHNSQYTNVEWITGCEIRSKIFCWPCLLFSKDVSVWNKTGYADLNHLSTAQKKHEKSQIHIQSFFSLQMLSKQRIGEVLIDNRAEIDRHNERVNENRNVLKRIIDAIIYLVKQGISLRSQDESSDCVNGAEGNCIEYLNVLREYDSVMDTHLKTATVFCGTSPNIQNEVIQAIADVINAHIKKEVEAASFVAIILHETSHVMTKSNLSTVLRFVHKGIVHERFIGFTDVSADRTSNGLFRHVANIVEEFQIQDKLVGQTCDGASVMSGHLNAFQSKVLNAYPLAIFIHGYAHLLNSVLQQGLSNIKECKSFFQNLNGLTTYFHKHLKRLHALREFMANRFPSIAPNNWNFTSRLCKIVHEYRSQYIQFFRQILENNESWDSDTVIQARGLLCFLEDSQTIKLLGVFSKLFVITDLLHNVLLNKSLDVLYCRKKVDDVLQQLKLEKSCGFEQIWYFYKREKNAKHKRSPQRLRNYKDEEDPCSFHQLHCKIVDNIIAQIKCRFSSLSNLEYFDLLCSDKYSVYRYNFPNGLIGKLQYFYGTLFDYVRLKNELVVLYSSSEFSEKPIHELLQFMMESKLEFTFKEVFKLAELIFTIPSTSIASEERSFCVLRKIKKAYRRKQSQDRLCGLSLISIEKKLLVELKQKDTFYADVIEQFMSQKHRTELTYL